MTFGHKPARRELPSGEAATAPPSAAAPDPPALAGSRVRLLNEASILSLTQQHELSVYNAAYLEVALRRNLPLATLDRRLREAAETMGVAVVRSQD